MEKTTEIRVVTATKEYSRNFWNAMRFDPNAEETIRSKGTGADSSFYAPTGEDRDIRGEIDRKSVIRSLATQLDTQRSAKVWAADSEDYASFVQEGEPIPGVDVMDDFTRFPVNSHKLAGLVKVSSELVHDAAFDLRRYISTRMGASFARAEDKAFIVGNGTTEPFGLLHATEGAETGVTTGALSYDDCVDLFFSVKPEYRAHATWLMNDRTALALRKLKDDAGNYLWNHANDTILGKPVRICNELPDIGEGAKPVLFGDFRYYWIVNRSPVSMNALRELFAATDRIGYIGLEFLDARLVRRDAVKAIAVSGEGV